MRFILTINVALLSCWCIRVRTVQTLPYLIYVHTYSIDFLQHSSHVNLTQRPTVKGETPTHLLLKKKIEIIHAVIFRTCSNQCVEIIEKTR